jgi:serine phosphatase RsbU (regulator of sigma subunit)
MSGTDDEEEYERTIVIGRKSVLESGAGPDVIGHYLIVAQEGEVGMRVELGAAPLTIGRGAKSALVLADTEVSRLHATITLLNGQVVAEDMGSTNGTFLGADRLTAPATLKEGDVLRMGAHFLRYERRSRRDAERQKAIDKDLQKASKYVFSLLPTPVSEGAVLAEWKFVPSTDLGGDAFGYYWLDSETFVFYLLDVSGHGAGSAMHSVSALNVLRQRALPGVDFKNPAEVLASLNERFQMETHGGLFFTMWYGVYRGADRTLTYGSAGHHPSYLVPAGKGTSTPLGMPAMMIGAMPGMEYDTQTVTVPPGSSVYVFSDGVFEVVTTTQERWSIDNFLPMLLEPSVAGSSESDRLYHGVKKATGPGPLEDDFSLMVLTFP